MTTTLPIAVGIFGSVGMLGWAAAALIPLLLHLWNRNQYREAPWAAMEFLLQAVQEQSRRMRIQQLLLLLLRMAIPIVLALSMADPVWQWLPSLGSSLGSRPPLHHVFVFDTSYSMGYQVAGLSRIDQAIKRAQEIVDQSPQGDGFTLILLADPAEVVVGEPVFAKADIQAELASVTLRDGGAELPNCLDLCRQTLESVSKNHTRLQKHKVYFFTDLGETTWQAASQESVRRRIGEIEKLAEILTVDVGIENAQNQAITSVRRSDPVVTPTRPQTWQVTVANLAGLAAGEAGAGGKFTGGKRVGATEVAMFVDDQLIEKLPVEIAGSESSGTSFRYQFDREGPHRVEFRLTEDALPVDNHHYEIVTVRQSINVLCVEGVPGAASNVAIALAPTPTSPVTTRVVAEHRLGKLPLADYDCVFLCNLRRFTAERTSQLRDYLKRGKGVVLFLGDQVQIDNYNQMLATDSPTLLPGRIASLVPPGDYRFDPRDYRHPIIQPFAGQERAGLLTTPVYRYMRVELPPDTQAEVALAFAVGDPVIVEHAVLGGHVTLVTTAASEVSVTRRDDRISPWTAWSAWPSFPPVVQEILSLSVSDNDAAANRVVGDSIYAILPASSGAQFVDIQHSSGAMSRRVAVQDTGGLPSWELADTFRSGFYRAGIPDAGGEQPFAVNLASTEESKLVRSNAADLPSQFQNSIRTDDGRSVTQSNASPLFRWMLGLLLALLLTESFVAWYLGNARA